MSGSQRRRIDLAVHRILCPNEHTDVPPHYSTVDAVALGALIQLINSGWSVLMEAYEGRWDVSLDYCTPRHSDYRTAGTGIWPEYHGTPHDTMAAAVCAAILETRTTHRFEIARPRTSELL